jgi:signal transduction histidine kinase
VPPPEETSFGKKPQLELLLPLRLTHNKKQRLLDINPAAEAMLTIDASTSKGQGIGKLLGNHPEILKTVNASISQEIYVVMEGQAHFIDVQFSGLENKKGVQIGRLFVLHDITKRIVGEEAQRVVPPIRSRANHSSC